MLKVMNRAAWQGRVGGVVLVLVALAAAIPPLASAQGASVEELERRLQRAKDEKARRDAAAAKAREEADAERRRKEAEAGRAAAERRAQESRLATVVVQTDAPCRLSVNGDALGPIPAGISKHRVSPGQKLVSCASTEEKASFEGELEARSGQDTVLRIALAEKVALEAQARRQAEERARAEAARQEQERLDREKSRLALASMNTRLQVVSSEVLLDSKWGLQWTRSDNGSNANWAEAQSHCRGLGGGWSLPTVEQLQSLHDTALPGIRCGGPLTCKVSDQFRLSGFWFWSAEPKGSSEAWLVALIGGTRFSSLVGSRDDGRALCVWRP